MSKGVRSSQRHSDFGVSPILAAAGELAQQHTLISDGIDVSTLCLKAETMENSQGKKHRPCLPIQVASNVQERLLSGTSPVSRR